jgi:hypothetical protein
MKRLLLGLVVSLFPALTQAEEVDLLLVLAADVSRSVDDVEFEIQRNGYVQAFSDKDVLAAIRNGARGKIAVAYIEWSGETAQRVLVDWTVIKDSATGKEFGAQLASVPRPFMDRTALGLAIAFATAHMATSPHEAPRKVIDMSGDGTNTNGPPPEQARDAAVAAGITVNGLVILSAEPMPWNPYHTHPPGGLEEYFRRSVIGGKDAFTEVVANYKDFAMAVRHKLIREIAGLDRPVKLADAEK